MPTLRSESAKHGQTPDASLPKQSEMHTLNDEQVNIDSANTSSAEGSGLVADDNDMQPLSIETADVELERAAATECQVAQLIESTSAYATVLIAGPSIILQDSNPIPSEATELPTNSDHPEISTQPSDELPLATATSIDAPVEGEGFTIEATAANHSSLCEASQVQPLAQPALPIGTDRLDLDDNKPSEPDQEQSLLHGTQLLPLVVPDSDSEERPPKATTGAVDSAIVISDDETEKRKRSPRKPRRASKRAFHEYVESENLWMTSTLKDLEDILHSTRQQMKLLKTTENQLVVAQEFIRNCGAEEEKVTERLEKSE